jgi:hypothetical protein
MMISIERIRELGETAAEQAVIRYPTVQAQFLCGQTLSTAQGWWAVMLTTGDRDKVFSYPLTNHLLREKDKAMVDILSAMIDEAIRQFLTV